MEPWEKLEFNAHEDTLRGFTAGWGSGRGWSREEMAQRVLWPHDWHIQVDSALEELVETFVSGKDCTVLVRSDSVEALLQALVPWEHRLSVQLKARTPIASASFSFSFKFYARQEANAVRQIFENLPDGVTISDDYQPRERSDAAATGPELYAPTHDYEFSGSGTVRGELRGVLQVSERASQHERVQRKPVQLQLAQ
jgi:hypothetical protein